MEPFENSLTTLQKVYIGPLVATLNTAFTMCHLHVPCDERTVSTCGGRVIAEKPPRDESMGRHRRKEVECRDERIPVLTFLLCDRSSCAHIHSYVHTRGRFALAAGYMSTAHADSV